MLRFEGGDSVGSREETGPRGSSVDFLLLTDEGRGMGEQASGIAKAVDQVGVGFGESHISKGRPFDRLSAGRGAHVPALFDSLLDSVERRY